MQKLPAIVFVFLISLSFFSLNGCGNKDENSNPASRPPYINATLAGFPQGGAPANFKSAMVEVRDGSSSGSSITTATVMMNGVPLIYNAATGHQIYEEDVFVSPGGTVDLTVTVAGNTYTATSTQFNSYPTISSPASGATWSTTSSHTVSWSGESPTTNAAYALGVLADSDPNGQLVWPASSSNNLYVVNISTYGYSIPANSMTSGERLVIVGIAKTEPIPNAAEKSLLGIIGFNYVPVTVN